MKFKYIIYIDRSAHGENSLSNPHDMIVGRNIVEAIGPREAAESIVRDGTPFYDTDDTRLHPTIAVSRVTDPSQYDYIADVDPHDEELDPFSIHLDVA